MVFDGEDGQVAIGDYSAKLNHHSIGRKKGEFTISFASGKCAVRNLSVTPK